MLQKIHALLLVFAATAVSCLAEPAPFPPTKFHTIVERGGHVIGVTITSKKFDRAKHNLMISPDGESLLEGHPKIDGRLPHGVDGYSIPKEEIDRFEVTWDGKPVALPRELYADCYTPVLCPVATGDDWIGNNQNKEKIGNMQVLGDGSGDAVLIVMRGFRWASACYEVYWTIRRDGRHSRFMQGFGS